MERLSGIDATFLYAETPEQPIVVNGVVTLDVSEMRGGYSFDRLRIEFARRLKEIPQFRRRLYDSAFNLGHPAWVEDYELDIRDHVKRLVMPNAHAPRAVEETCGVLASRPLDRSRPLWEAFVLEDPEDPDIVTVLVRAHHSVIDGMTASKLISLLTGSPDDYPERDPGLMRIEAGGKNAVQLIVGGAVDYVTRPWRIARLLPATVALPFAMRKVGGGDADAAALPGVDDELPKSTESVPERPGQGMPVPFSAPRTRFNATLTPHRSLATAALRLDDVNRVKNAFGVKVNDVFLAAVGGGLRHYLGHHDDLPEKSLSAVVPVSVHTETHGRSNNKISVMFSHLGTDIADPVERLSSLRSGSPRVKSQSSTMRPSFVQDWASMSPGTVLNLGLSLYRQFRLAEYIPVVYNLIVSNVPGPTEPVYFLGARVRHLYPMGPLLHGFGLNVTAFSLGEHLNIGVIACEHLVPDPERVTRAIEDEFAALLAALDADEETVARLRPA